MLTLSSQHETISALRRQLHRRGEKPSFPSGLDAILPDGLRRGTMVEYLADSGSGATSLALIAAREACREDKALVVIDGDGQFYPLAGALNSLLIRPQNQKDERWALNQSLACQGVGAVLCWPRRLDDRSFRSLQLAAERGGSVGLLLRPTNVRGQPSWSDLQLLVESLPGGSSRRLRIEVVRCRNGKTGASMEVELDDETGTTSPLHLAAELAPSAAKRYAQSAS